MSAQSEGKCNAHGKQRLKLMNTRPFIPMRTILFTIGLISVVGACSAAAAADSAALRAANETYRTCATLSLPDNFSKVGNPRLAAEAALDLCQKKRLAVAGQFALDNPGTRKTGEYVEGVRQRLAVDLATWMTDMKTLGVQVGIQGPR
jgi:hypothetical protein